jgi:hypothetical protein
MPNGEAVKIYDGRRLIATCRRDEEDQLAGL